MYVQGIFPKDQRVISLYMIFENGTCYQPKTTYYVDYGKTVKEGKKTCDKEGDFCSVEYRQKMTLLDGSVCDTGRSRTCTCR